MKLNRKGLALALLLAAVSITGCKKKNVTDTAPVEQQMATTDGDSEEAKTDSELAEGDVRDAMLALQRVHFGFDSADLTEDSRSALSEAGQKLADKAAVHLYVEGHADAAGETEYNMTLGEKRAKAVSEYLEKLGVAAERLHIVSYGEEVPLKQGATKESMAANRRVDFKLMRGDIELVLEESKPVVE